MGHTAGDGLCCVLTDVIPNVAQCSQMEVRRLTDTIDVFSKRHHAVDSHTIYLNFAKAFDSVPQRRLLQYLLPISKFCCIEILEILKLMRLVTIFPTNKVNVFVKITFHSVLENMSSQYSTLFKKLQTDHCWQFWACPKCKSVKCKSAKMTTSKKQNKLQYIFRILDVAIFALSHIAQRENANV